MKRRWGWYVAGTVVLALAGLGTAWNGGFESSPAGSDLLSDLDTFIQQFKVEARFRSSVEEEWGTNGGDNGLNRIGSARAFIQNAAPTDLAGPGQYNNSGAGSYGVTTLSGTELNGTDDLGKGRFWVDADGTTTHASATTDDNLLNVWNETANAFQNVVARDAGAAGIGGQNLLYNGSFEVTDGTTGATASTTTPAGWTNLNTSTIAYTDPVGVSEGEGLALKTTAAGGGNEGVRQALTSLKASTTYVFRVRVRATAGDTCNLNVSDGTTTVTDTTTTTGAYETLEAVLTTTAAPATVNVDLRSTADTDICEWDNATVFERFASVKQAGVEYCNSTSTETTENFGGGAMHVNPFLSCAVTPPSSAYAVEVTVHQCLDNDDGSGRVAEMDLRENGTPVAWTGGLFLNNNTAGDSNDMGCLETTYVKLQPTPGTTLTYTTASGIPGSANIMDNDNDGNNISTFTVASFIRVKLVPTN